MTVLALEDLSVSFDGVSALSGVSLSFPPAKIIGVIGPNGAGKTTLLNAVSGLLEISAGRVLLDNECLNKLGPTEIAKRGVRRTFQTSQLFQGMTVLENMMVGMHLKFSAGLLGCVFRSARMRAEEQEMQERALEALSFVGFAHYADRPGSALSFGEQRIVEVARTLMHEPKVVLLDEPAVGLSINRVAELDHLLRRIRDERGITLIMIEHVIRLVMGVADHIVVMNAGRMIAAGPPDVVKNDPQVIEAYLGHQGRH